MQAPVAFFSPKTSQFKEDFREIWVESWATTIVLQASEHYLQVTKDTLTQAGVLDFLSEFL
jgi:hypothetical protein